MTDWDTARRNMVDSQIRPNSVTDRRIFDALLHVPRERFVAPGQRALAYCDEDVLATDPGEGETGRYLIAAMPFARMVQLAAISAADHVLDIGCASGYSSAVIAQLAGSVVALEENPELAARAQDLLAETGVDNVAVVQAPLTGGYPSQGPYDVILVEGAVDEVPAAILDQLSDGGRLVAVISGRRIGRAHIFTRTGHGIGERPVFDATVPPLPGFRRKPAFVF
jgi:protein-L-isoaspartate(D-aspartate) O-methyltransferase